MSVNLMNKLGIVKKNIKRADPKAVEKLSQFGSATVSEAMGKVGLMNHYMKPIYPTAKTCGTAVTVLLQPGDNWMLFVAAEQIQPGDIVVAACVTDCFDGFFGDLIATSYMSKGAKGFIIDGGVRDVNDVTKMGFPVFSRAIYAKGTTNMKLGSVNIPVVCAGALVNPGDVIVADIDGIAVVPADRAMEIAELAQKREDDEAHKRKEFAKGVLGLDYYNMRDDLANAGLKYID